MKTVNLSRIVTLVLLFGISVSLFAQEEMTIKVIMKNGVENTYIVNSESRVSYSETNATFNTKEGNYTLSLYDIKRILFISHTGVNEGVGSILIAYPNPTSGFVKLQGITEKQNVLVYSINGQLVLSDIVEEDGIVNLGKLDSGLYFIKTKEKTYKTLKL